MQRSTMGAWWCLFLCPLLLTCCASDIKCTKSQNGDKTVCSIAEESRVSNSSVCVFSWIYADDGNIVLANEKQKNPELVESYSINDLVTSKLLNIVAFSRHCPSETPVEVNCTETSLGPEKHEGLTDPTDPPSANLTGSAEGKDSNSKHVVPVTVTVILILVALVVGVIIGVFNRDKILRSRCWSQIRGIWTPVKQADDSQVAWNVEAGIK
ncbi:uncharacterized protein LOC131988815 isoform X2 [Centropristis striata]|uniref:uncharacterized protein LOC131988815 isoform X2 n=1 Tax=Centropristis striata TaxID=184440 RepID=UPI0027DFDAD1|nr:uncharacterized protein LOC131988815 isoform X2 [Centropristis striata]